MAFDDPINLLEHLERPRQRQALTPPLPRLRPERRSPRPDFSSEATEEAPDFSAFAEEAPAATLGDYARETGKGLVRGGVGMVGTALSGAAALDPQQAYRRDIARYRNDLARVIEMDDGELDLLHARIRQEPSVITRRILQRTVQDLIFGRISPDEIAGTPTPTPMAERELFKAGRALSEGVKERFPVGPGFEDSWTAALSEGLGTVGTGILASVLAGPVAAGGAFTVTGMGEAANRAIDYDEAERKAGKPGLTEEQIALATLYGSAPGATDIVPIEILLTGAFGRLIPPQYRRPLAQAIARIGGQAVIEGVQEGGQQYLQNLIAREVYDPEQPLGESIFPSAEVGGAVGGLTGTLYEVVRSIAGRRGGRAQPQPRPQAQPEARPEAPDFSAEATPEGVPEGAAPADLLYPEPEEEPETGPREEPVLPTPAKRPEINLPTAGPKWPITEEPRAAEITLPETVVTPEPAQGEGAPDFSAEAISPGTRPSPVTVEKPEDLETAAEVVAKEPTDAQKIAGNYSKGHIKLQGLDITIENPKGSVRSKKDAKGKTLWEVQMPAAYGYIKRTKGADSKPGKVEQLDVYVGEKPDSDRVFVIDQVDAESDAFDEHKAMVGFGDRASALATYSQAFSDGRGPDRIGGVTEMSVDEFKAWVKEGDTTKALASKAKVDDREKPSAAPVVTDVAASDVAQNVQKSEKLTKSPEIDKKEVKSIKKEGESPVAEPAPTPQTDEKKVTSEKPQETVTPAPKPKKPVTPQVEALPGTAPLGKKAAPVAPPAEAPTEGPAWAEVLAAIPKDEKGRPDLDLAGRLMFEISGIRQASFNDLDAKQKAELLKQVTAAAKELAVPARPTGYGAKNKLVSAQRAEELRRRLKAKLRNQVSSGIDPEIVAIGTELAVFHIEAGARKFVDMAKAIANDLNVAVESLRPYLRSWYNGARDMMEDAGEDIAGMDSPDQVRAALATLGQDEADADAREGLQPASPEVPEGAPAGDLQPVAEGGPARAPRRGRREDGVRDVSPDLVADGAVAGAPGESARAEQGDRGDTAGGRGDRAERGDLPAEAGELTPAAETVETERQKNAATNYRITADDQIGQVQAGARGVRHAEDVDDPLPEAAQLKAAASGDPRIMDHAILTKSVRDLEAQRRVHERTIYESKRGLAATQDQVKQLRQLFDVRDADAGKVIDLKGDKFAVDLSPIGAGAAITKREDAGKVIIAFLEEQSKAVWGGAENASTLTIGTMSGLDMQVQAWRTADGVVALPILKGAARYDGIASMFSPEADPMGMVRRFENILAAIVPIRDETRVRLDSAEASIPRLEELARDRPFPREDLYQEDKAKLAELSKALAPPKPGSPGTAAQGPPSGGPSASDLMAKTAEGEARVVPTIKLTGPQRKRIERKLSEIVSRIGGKKVRLEFRDVIQTSDVLSPEHDAQLRAAAEARGRELLPTVLGFYDPARALIAIALEDPTFGVGRAAETAGHEAWHHVETKLLSDGEYNLLRRDLRDIAAYAASEKSATVDQMMMFPAEEITAIAFTKYWRRREARGLASAIVRIFDKIIRALRQIRVMLKGEGIETWQDIFEEARTGAIARREDLQGTMAEGLEAALASTGEAARQTDTPAFKAWFGDSKVVDAEGRPLVVYHGTTANFETFEEARLGETTRHPTSKLGFFFSADPAIGSLFTEAVDQSTWPPTMVQRQGANVMPVYLRVEKPFELSVEKFREIQGTPYGADFEAAQPQAAERFANYIEQNKARLVAQGFDGIHVRGDPRYDERMGGEEYAADTWVAFRPEQIKSAIANRGTFDRNVPSILGATIESHEANPFAPGGAEARRRAMNHGLDFAPIDRVMRLPFDIFGGRNQKGEWKPGLYLSAKTGHLITAARFSDTGRFTWLNPIMHRVRAGLIDRYGLEDAYVARDRRRSLEERAILSDVPELMRLMEDQGIKEPEAKVLHAMLTGEPVPPSEFNKLAEPIRNAIDAFGAEAVELGLISAESYERNRGKYLHRVYLKHENDQGGLSRWVAQMMGSRRKKIVGETLKGRGLWKEVSADRLVGKGEDAPPNGAQFIIADKMDAVGRIYLRPGQSMPADHIGRGRWEVRGRRGKNVVLWRDYTKAEREKMGEITDARYTIAKTYMAMAHDLSVGRFYRDIALNKDWTSASEPEGSWKEADDFSRLKTFAGIDWVRVPDSKIPKSGAKRYGALAGKWVRAEIWQDINETEKLNRSGLWSELMTQWKLSKTARSPVVHMNNIVSNLMLMDMSGVGLSDLAAGIRSLVTRDELYQDAEKHGAFGADMATQEIRRNILEPLLKEIERDIQGGQGTIEARFGLIGKLADALWSGAKRVDRFMLDMYRLEDEVFRMALYARRRAQGVEAQEAADEAREQFIDYDIKAPWVNTARRTVLPFIAYTYRAVPILARTLMTRPWKIAKYGAIAYAANALSYLLLPGDEDEERRSMREEVQGWTWVGAPRMIRLPFADDFGNPMFLDIRRWMPAGDIFDTNQGTLGELGIPAPLQFGGPLMLAAELAMNRQAFTGNPIYNEITDDFWDRSAKVGDWLWKSAMPSAAVVPGSWYWEKVGTAINSKLGWAWLEYLGWGSEPRDRQGRPLNIPAAIASSVGVKIAPHDVEEGFRVWGLIFDKEERELKSELSRAARDRSRGLLSDREFEAQRNKLVGKLRGLDERRRGTFAGAPVQ